MKSAVYKCTHKGMHKWLTRPVRAGEPEHYDFIYDGKDAKLLAWEKAKELNEKEGRRAIAA